jgi:hypothetical protein
VFEQRHPEILAVKVIGGFHTVDNPVGICPTARADLAERKIVQPAFYNKTVHELHGILLYPVRQFDIIGSALCRFPDIGPIVPTRPAAAKVETSTLKHSCNVLLLHIVQAILIVGRKERFQHCPQLISSLVFIETQIKYVFVILLISAQNVVERFINRIVQILFFIKDGNVSLIKRVLFREPFRIANRSDEITF